MNCKKCDQPVIQEKSDPCIHVESGEQRCELGDLLIARGFAAGNPTEVAVPSDEFATLDKRP